LKGYNSSNFKQLWIIGDDLVMSSLIFLVLWMMHMYSLL
jgi:hypothetical protein